MPNNIFRTHCTRFEVLDKFFVIKIKNNESEQ